MRIGCCSRSRALGTSLSLTTYKAFRCSHACVVPVLWQCTSAVALDCYAGNLRNVRMACPQVQFSFSRNLTATLCPSAHLSPQIGYPCPAKLDNGRACTGSVIRTHHKYPSNNKKKQKRIEAAAAAATAARQKPQPVAKPKAVAVATAAVKGVDVAKARIMPMSMSNNGERKFYSVMLWCKCVAPTSTWCGPAATCLYAEPLGPTRRSLLTHIPFFPSHCSFLLLFNS